jgi:hypothetical protein
MEQIVTFIISSDYRTEAEMKHVRNALMKHHTTIANAPPTLIDNALAAIDPRASAVGFVYLLYVVAWYLGNWLVGWVVLMGTMGCATGLPRSTTTTTRTASLLLKHALACRARRCNCVSWLNSV